MKKLLLLLGVCLLAATNSIHSMERVPHLLLNQVNSRLKTGARAIWRNRNTIGYAACTIASSHVLNQGLIACLEGQNVNDTLKLFCTPQRIAHMLGLCVLKEYFATDECRRTQRRSNTILFAGIDHFISAATSLRHFFRAATLPVNIITLKSQGINMLGSYFLCLAHIFIVASNREL